MAHKVIFAGAGVDKDRMDTVQTVRKGAVMATGTAQCSMGAREVVVEAGLRITCVEGGLRRLAAGRRGSLALQAQWPLVVQITATSNMWQKVQGCVRSRMVCNPCSSSNS